VRHAALLGLGEVVQRRPGRDQAEAELLDAEALQRVRLEVPQQRLVGELVAEDPVLLGGEGEPSRADLPRLILLTLVDEKLCRLDGQQ